MGLDKDQLVNLFTEKGVVLFGGRLSDSHYNLLSKLVPYLGSRFGLVVVTGGLSIENTVMLEASRFNGNKAVGVLCWEDLESYSDVINENDFKELYVAENLGEQLFLMNRCRLAFVFPGKISTCLEWLYWIVLWQRKVVSRRSHPTKVEKEKIKKPIIFIGNWWRLIYDLFVRLGIINRRYLGRYVFFCKNFTEVKELLESTNLDF